MHIFFRDGGIDDLCVPCMNVLGVGFPKVPVARWLECLDGFFFFSGVDDGIGLWSPLVVYG